MKVTLVTIILLIVALGVYAVHNKTMHDLHRDEKRQALVKGIIKKIQNLSFYVLLHTSPKNRAQMLKRIRRNLEATTKKMNKSYGTKYVELIMVGIQSFLDSQSPELKLSRHVKSRHSHKRGRSGRRRTTRAPSARRHLAGQAAHYTDGDACDCSCVERGICAKIWSLGKFTCYTDQNKTSIDKLCDGHKDCDDNSDEEHCALHAENKFFEAKWLIKEIQRILPKRCLEVQISADKVVVATKEKTLSNVLKNQQSALNTVLLQNSKKSKESKLLKKESNKIALVVSNVAKAFEGALCIREVHKNLITRSDGSSIDHHKTLVGNKARSWAPPLCTCDGQLCAGNNCTSACNNTCWQRYTFGKWVCLGLSGAPTVSIDLICDGKVDCYDESDENGCTKGVKADKFEATQLYDDILRILSSKTRFTDFSPQLSKLINLQEAIRSLQKQSMADDADASAVKLWRDEVFSGLLSIYESTLSKANDIVEVDGVYNLLRSVNNKLVDAMKRSKTGNARLVFHGCQCTAGKCLQVQCPAACVRFCAVRDLFTKYACRGTGEKIPIRNLCDGKIECPEKDDEDNCKPGRASICPNLYQTKSYLYVADEESHETNLTVIVSTMAVHDAGRHEIFINVCRNHHLLLLRHKIQNYENVGGSHAFIEAFDSWKQKTNSTISTIEKKYVTHRKDLLEVVTEILDNLVRVYAAVSTPKRRNTDNTITAFQNLARVVQDILRECTN